MSDIANNILGGATAGLIARCICHPIDTLKSRIQSGKGEFAKSLYSTIKITFRTEGFLGFYRGVGAVAVGGVPGVSLYLSSYELFKEMLSSRLSSKYSKDGVYFLSGMLAEAISCVIFVPIDVVKERLQVQTVKTSSSTAYTSSLDALQKIYALEGLRGIYKGYSATLFSYGPFSALYFLLYEKLKEQAYRHRVLTASFATAEQELTFQGSLLCSSVAGAAASYVTSPLDLAKLRLQIDRAPIAIGGGAATTQGGAGSTVQAPMRGLWDVLRRVYTQEGVVGLFRGATARVIFHTPCTAITMALFERCSRWWASLLQP